MAELRETLRQWRLSTARSLDKPAYIVFSNKVLDAIVDARPTSVAALQRIQGMGATKCAKYGDDVCRIVSQYGGGDGRGRAAASSSYSSPGKRARQNPPLASRYQSPTKRQRPPQSPSSLRSSPGAGSGAGAGGRSGPGLYRSSSLEVEARAQAARIAQQRKFGAGRGKSSDPNFTIPAIATSSLTKQQRAIAERVLSGSNTFLTGPAGCGKSYLFRYLIQELKAVHGPEAVAVTAPTGVAAGMAVVDRVMLCCAVLCCAVLRCAR